MNCVKLAEIALGQFHKQRNHTERLLAMLVGVDIGGTFTDLVLSEGGQLHVHKLLSTPQEPASAMLTGLRHLAGEDLASLKHIAHGTTVATNAILERRGAKTALLVTAGYEDVLYIGRQDRPDLYALHPEIPEPLVPRELCLGVPERQAANGEVVTPLDETALQRLIDTLREHEIEAVAVCLLYSFIDPTHERKVREAIVTSGLLGATQVALSHEVLPEFREYERASTTTLEAYVRPVISRYLNNLNERLPAPLGLRVMKSDGGVIRTERATQEAVQTALSGPAAGVIGAHYLAALAGYPNIITLDMGGTSTDIALVAGEPARRPQSEIDGLPLRVRLLDIDTVGAGGGSIARLDSGGALRVGPQSAGATPGPIAYGNGGEAVTVTDANVVLGRLDPDHFLGGEMNLKAEAAENALRALGQQANMSAQEAAAGIVKVANVNIDRALRRVSVARGHDPRDFTLVAFGGAGPLHACEVAAQLDIPRVLIPQTPGVLCAFGLLVADVQVDYAQAILRPLTAELPTRLEDIAADLHQQAVADLDADGIPAADQHTAVVLDMRYQGQGYELQIELEDDLSAAFHAAHRQEYGYALEEAAIEVVNLRLTASGTIQKPNLTEQAQTPNDASDARLRTRADGVVLYKREQLTPGATFEGEALVFQLDSTIYIPAGWSARVDGYHNLVLTAQVAG